MERIEAAAVMEKGELVCFVPRPGRHHDVLRRMARAGFPIPIVGTQGFITSAGRFVDRYEARKIAEAAGQIIAGRIDKDGIPYKADHPQLFSEDVW